jgi:hypothetical protein
MADKLEEKAAEVVERARKHDQNAQAVIHEVRNNAKRGNATSRRALAAMTKYAKATSPAIHGDSTSIVKYIPPVNKKVYFSIGGGAILGAVFFGPVGFLAGSGLGFIASKYLK